MKERKTIGIDFDGTISNSIVNVIDFLNRKYKKNFSLGDVKTFWYQDLYGITRNELSQAYADVLINNEKIELVDPQIPSIIGELKEICDVYLVTYSYADEKYISEYLKQHDIIMSGILITKNKADLKDAEFFVDDSAHNAFDLSKLGKRVILLKKWYYNYGEEINQANIIQVNDWKEIRSTAINLLSQD